MTTIDLNENLEDSQVRTWYKKLMLNINEIDTILDASLDSSGKRKFTDELVQKTTDQWTPVTETWANEMLQMPEEIRAGVYFGVIRALTQTFKVPTDKWIDAQVALLPKIEVPVLPDEEKKALQEKRSELAKQVNAIIDMAYTFGEASGDQENSPDPNWPKPRGRRGAFGTRRPRALSFYTWKIDDVQQEGDADSSKGVSASLGFAKASDFTKALKEARIDTTNPPENFEVLIKGRKVYAEVEKEDEEEDITQPSDDDDENGED